MPARYEVRKLTADDVDAAAQLLADLHRRHRANVPALNSDFESAANCAPLISERLAQDGATGTIAFSGGRPAGYVLFTSKDATLWGPNAWADDASNAGEGEAIRECYAAVAGDLVEAGIRNHWALVPASDAQLIEGWFSMSFGVQHDHGLREPAGADFEPPATDGISVRRPTTADIPVLAELDLVLPNHVKGSPVFSKAPIHTVEEVAAELAEDINDPKYSFWVAEHDGRVIATLVGTSLESSSGWGPLTRPRSCGFLGYAATLPHARGLGAGRALTDAFLLWARDKSFESLACDWRATNVEANRTWRAMGFRPHYLRLFRSIP